MVILAASTLYELIMKYVRSGTRCLPVALVVLGCSLRSAPSLHRTPHTPQPESSISQAIGGLPPVLLLLFNLKFKLSP